jgi:TonB-linked SusC/RagA family outer membrane protein
MKLFKRWVVTVVLCLAVLPLYAQTRDVKGTVYDSDGKTPLAGVTVLLKGTTKFTLAANDGMYSLSVTGENPVLVFQLLGYETQEIPAGSRAIIDVIMKEAALQLSEVVVTALGMTREEKSLGYAVTKISNEELTGTVSSNWMNAMSGKVAGLVFDHAGTGPGGTMRVTLRGDQSLNHGANGALFVVDGVPINSGAINSGSGSNYANVDAPVDFGGGASEINPDDVESVTVLKGPAATALYGSRAANGAIVITTKSGKKDKGLGITVNSSITFEQAGYWPDFQTEYGSGSDMGIDPFNFWIFTAENAPDGKARGSNYSRYAFGEKFNPNTLRYQYASKNWETGEYTPTPWVYQDDWYTGLFRTGVTYNNSIAVEGNNGKGTSSRFAFTDSRNEWILPNTGYQQQTISVSLNTEMNRIISLKAKVNYLHKGSDNLPINGYNESGALYDLVWGFNSNSINDWKDEYFSGRFNYLNWSGDRNVANGGYGLVYPSQSGYNPYRTLYEELNSMDKDRVFGNVTLSLKLYEGLTLDLRSGLDLATEFRTQQKPFYTTGRQYGFYREQSYQQYELNTDFLFHYVNNKLAGERLGLSVSFGGNNMQNKYHQERTTLTELAEENIYNTNNVRSGTVAEPYNYRSRKVVNSLYGVASLSWDDTYFLDVTGRNDWSSTLSRSNWSFFYPSVAGSVLLDRVLDFSRRAPWIDLLKLRLSWANVGNDTSPYSLDQTYSVGNYSGSYRLPGTIPDPMIKPENVASWEIGLEGRFFENRIGFDLAMYKSSTTNQIVSVSTDWIIGASGMRINAGEIENKGIELSAHVVPVKTRNFSWSMDFNWSRIWNKLVRLQDDWDPTVPFQTNPGSTIGSRTYIYSYVGQEMNVIYGKGYQKAPQGSYYTDEYGNQVDCSGMDLVNSSGYPVLDEQPTTRIGKVNPDWRAGLNHKFAYKDFSLSLFFTGQWGGNTFSVTNFSLSYQGKLKNSLEGRYDGLVHPGVNEVVNADGTVSYTKNSTVTSSIQTYYNAYVWVRDNTANNTFNTSFLKLKEVRFDYRLPKTITEKTGFLQGASIGVFATNLFCITEFPQYDPEAGMMSGSNDVYRGIEAMTFPMTRTYGLNIKLSF